MSWQLWVLIAATASCVAAVLVAKLSQAQEVFDRIVETGPPVRPDRTVDELIRHRRRQEPRPAWFFQTAHPQHRSRGQH